MRAVKVSLPPETVPEVLQLLKAHKIKSASRQLVDHIDEHGDIEERIDISFDTSAPKAKAWLDSLFSAPFFDPAKMSVVTRQRRAIVSSTPTEEVTRPWVEPGVDIQQGLWVFSHPTLGFALRVVLSGAILAYGVINSDMLLMIASMLFLPLVPVVMALGVGLWWGQKRMFLDALMTLLLGLGLLFLTAMGVAYFSTGPVRFDSFPPVYIAAIISTVVGISSALANSDEGGRREVIGLATAAQIAILPVWLGVCVVLGFPGTDDDKVGITRLLSLVINILCIAAASLATYIAIGAFPRSSRPKN